ncbi:MAG: hypothetical protein HQK59_18035 [Deltaproteobacteria bacterium]|nr:hypothetical protein [Deltaproteobacteria bacterium]
MPNIFWLGGTGTNVAMAYARMQYLGLISDNPNVRHYFIDTPENFGLAASDDRQNINIGVNEFLKLKLNQEPKIINLT